VVLGHGLRGKDRGRDTAGPLESQQLAGPQLSWCSGVLRQPAHYGKIEKSGLADVEHSRNDVFYLSRCRESYKEERGGTDEVGGNRTGTHREKDETREPKSRSPLNGTFNNSH